MPYFFSTLKTWSNFSFTEIICNSLLHFLIEKKSVIIEMPTISAAKGLLADVT